MRKSAWLMGLFMFVFMGAAQASTNVVSSGDTALLIPTTAPQGTFLSAPTGRVEVVGSLVREGGIIRQRTVNGWEQCPRERNMVLVQVIGGAGTAVVVDSTGDLARLSVNATIIFTNENAPRSGVSIRAEGGDVTVFTSHR